MHGPVVVHSHARATAAHLDGVAHAAQHLLDIFEAGDRLELNLATSAAGEILVELRDAEGKAIEGFTFDDAVPTIGNEIAKTVRWKGDPDLGALAGRPVRIAFRLVDADLFAFRFADDD